MTEVVLFGSKNTYLYIRWNNNRCRVHPMYLTGHWLAVISRFTLTFSKNGLVYRTLRFRRKQYIVDIMMIAQNDEPIR